MINTYEACVANADTPQVEWAAEEYSERWGAGVETQKMYGERLMNGVEYHLMSPTPRR